MFTAVRCSPASPFAMLVRRLDGIDPDLVDWATDLDVASPAEAWNRCSPAAMIDIAHAMGVDARPILWALYCACDAAAGSMTGPLRELSCVAIGDYGEVDQERARAVARAEADTTDGYLLRAAMSVIAYGDVCYPGARLGDESLSYAIEAAALADEILAARFPVEQRAAEIFRRGLTWATVAAANSALVTEVEAHEQTQIARAA